MEHLRKIMQIEKNSRHVPIKLPVLAAVTGALVLFSPGPYSTAYAQDSARLNQLVQSGTASSGAAIATFRQGRELIAQEQWPRAEQVFGDFVKSNPGDKNADAAFYWLAFSLKKQSKYEEADTALEKLIAVYPKSTWVTDAKAMRTEIAPQLGTKGTRIVQESAQSNNDEVKILALQSLMTLDVQRGSEMATSILKPNSGASVRLKGAALSLLGRYGGKTALPTISSVARNESDLALRKRALSALAASDDDSVLDILKEQVVSSKDSSITSTALSGIARNASPRALSVLGELASSSQLSPTVRKTAIAYISTRKGEPAVDELTRLYDSNSPTDIKRQVISGFGYRKSPRAQEKLIQIVRSSEPVELRSTAVHALVRRGSEGPIPLIDVLLQLYDSERNSEVMTTIVEQLASSNDKRAQAKLMEVARNTNSPVEIRKTAVMALSRSKDPEILKFLEDILK
jgi:HEAT repeat protein